jgi:predicted DNA-binding transcriptional regulator AlpA
MPKQIETQIKAAQQRKVAKLAEILALWHNLPDEALVPLPVVCAIRGRSPASIWRDVSQHRCPAPVSAGPRCTRWRVGDLRKAV